MNNIIKDRKELINIREKLKSEEKIVVFSNGCFDILHAGHVDYLNKAKMFGDILIVALNSDNSMRRIKGESRPIVNEDERAFIIANLKAVDYVTVFDEDTPQEIISALIPDVLVKGNDWALEEIVGRDIVENAGGKVEQVEFINRQSTTNIIKTILSRFKE